MNSLALSRRRFLKTTGALIVSFNLLPPLRSVSAQTGVLPNGDLDPASLDSWLAIAADGTVTVFTSKVELGTGIETALAQIAAEELDVSWKRVKVIMGDTALTVNQSATGGSRTLERAGPQIRQAAAAARKELLHLAAEKFGVTVDRLNVKDGIVSDGGAKKVSYAQLVGGKKFNLRITASGAAADLKLADDVKAKTVKDYQTVGSAVPRFDIPPKLTGEAVYINDLRIPGMLQGRVVRPPTISTEPINVDENSVKGIAGVVKVVRAGKFVGVVAKTEWAAIKAARELKVTWAKPTTKLPNNPEELYGYLKNTKPLRTQKAVDRGNVDNALGAAKKTYARTYRWPLQLHGMIGPSCAIADVKAYNATIWCGTQGPFRSRKNIATLLKLPEKDVRVIYHEGSGSYGRLATEDAGEDAALLSRAVGAPVRVQWSREDEHGWEPKGPAQIDEVRAAVDGDGNWTAWEFTDLSLPRTEADGTPMLASVQVGIKSAAPDASNGSQSAGEIYGVENQRIFANLINWRFAEPHPLRTSQLRAPGDISRCFATECTLDEIATDLKQDPVEFRLRYLAKDRRASDCLQAAAAKAQWQKRVFPALQSNGNIAKGRGIALTRRSGAYVATVVDIELNKTNGQIAVKHIVCAHDCGLIVNPDGVRNQIEGNVVQGVSRALFEELTFDGNGVNSLDWKSYPILRFSDLPELDVVLINRAEIAPLGAGEPATIPVAAAIGNAIFDAIGLRLYEAPFTPARVMAAIKKTT
jgi:CO/xanthine dehydrogenase Mo-binding subunit